MIAKFLNKSSATFGGVEYNDNKVGKGTGELMSMKNFPAFINQSSSQAEVSNYLMSISKNDRIKNKQFHVVLSAEGRTRSKETLAVMADMFMDKMGYGKQPYIVVFHNDTSNNHVHIVSTREDRETGQRVNESFER